MPDQLRSPDQPLDDRALLELRKDRLEAELGRIDGNATYRAMVGTRMEALIRGDLEGVRAQLEEMGPAAAVVEQAREELQEQEIIPEAAASPEVLRLVQELTDRVARLEAEVAALRAAPVVTPATVPVVADAVPELDPTPVVVAGTLAPTARTTEEKIALLTERPDSPAAMRVIRTHLRSRLETLDKKLRGRAPRGRERATRERILAAIEGIKTRNPVVIEAQRDNVRRALMAELTAPLVPPAPVAEESPVVEVAPTVTAPAPLPAPSPLRAALDRIDGLTALQAALRDEARVQALRTEMLNGEMPSLHLEPEEAPSEAELRDDAAFRTWLRGARREIARQIEATRETLPAGAAFIEGFQRIVFDRSTLPRKVLEHLDRYLQHALGHADAWRADAVDEAARAEVEARLETIRNTRTRIAGTRSSADRQMPVRLLHALRDAAAAIQIPDAPLRPQPAPVVADEPEEIVIDLDEAFAEIPDEDQTEVDTQVPAAMQSAEVTVEPEHDDVYAQAVEEAAALIQEASVDEAGFLLESCDDFLQQAKEHAWDATAIRTALLDGRIESYFIKTFFHATPRRPLGVDWAQARTWAEKAGNDAAALQGLREMVLFCYQDPVLVQSATERQELEAYLWQLEVQANEGQPVEAES